MHTVLFMCLENLFDFNMSRYASRLKNEMHSESNLQSMLVFRGRNPFQTTSFDCGRAQSLATYPRNGVFQRSNLPFLTRDGQSKFLLNPVTEIEDRNGKSCSCRSNTINMVEIITIFHKAFFHATGCNSLP